MAFGPKRTTQKRKSAFQRGLDASAAHTARVQARTAMSSAKADKDPPKNSPAMSGFRNLGGISGRK